MPSETRWDGKPLHSERAGWHWLTHPSYGTRPVRYAVDSGLNYWGDPMQGTPAWAVAQEWTYLAPCLPPAAPAPSEQFDRLLQAAEQVLDDMGREGTCCCPAARDALRGALVPWNARLAEIDGNWLPPAAPNALAIPSPPAQGGGDVE